MPVVLDDRGKPSRRSRDRDRKTFPLVPTLSPLEVYTDLFMNFVPNASYRDTGHGLAAAAPAADATLTNLAKRRSVLDFAAKELNALRQMGPAEARMKLDNHFQAVTAMEGQLQSAIDQGYPTPTGTGGGGSMGMGGASGMGGAAGAGGAGGAAGTDGGADGWNRWWRERHMQDEATGASERDGHAGQTGRPRKPVQHQRQHRAKRRRAEHAGGGRSPFLRAEGRVHLRHHSLRHVPAGARHEPHGLHALSRLEHDLTWHHPTSHHILTPDTEQGSSLTALKPEAQFLFAVQRWFFARQAENLKDWKNSYDGYGNSLLDYTVVPFLTEVRATSHERDNLPGMIIGGKALGFGHNVYQAGRWSTNDYWATIARAFGFTSSEAPLGLPIVGLRSA